MTEEEYQMYSKADEIIVKNFSLKITDNTLETGGTKQKCNNATFNISIRKRLSELVLEHCEVTPKTSIKAAITRPATKLITKTLNSHINDAWRSCKKKFLDTKQSIQVNDIVMAKMKTYSAWPARLLAFTQNNKRASVHFFGTNNTGHVDVIEIVPFHHCHDVITLLLLRKLGDFHKGITEIETILKVPDDLSLLKQVESLK